MSNTRKELEKELESVQRQLERANAETEKCRIVARKLAEQRNKLMDQIEAEERK